MAFTYKPLWKLLIDKGMTKKSLMNLTGISKSTMDKMYREEYVALSVIDRICEKLQCNISDVISYERKK
ncbi:MAG: helix-turn-helix transcriptional regulator [Clostridia bacterium]|nr:helix-turn-helix transcriptional regulator [Selenomonadaceae bacterium]MBR3050835.1 helix-turn-helix transcriptional regulator [Selenomonadaceae bacterium]MBR3960692.1 helix-turn-helix transcriptional regulator [Clostridia bacterium]